MTSLPIEQKVTNTRHHEGQGIFLFASASRPALGPTQTPAQKVPWAVSPGIK